MSEGQSNAISGALGVDFSRVTDGVQNLIEGYLDYSREVIVNRALPELRDGFKPVNRRILYIMYKMYKRGEKIKCNDIAGSVMRLHPHGDTSIYQSLVLMTDQNGTMALPVIEGQGNFGGVHTTDQAAASRYTEAKLNEVAMEYLGELDGVKFVPNFNSTLEEPEVLPVSYPAVLCNSTTGIAVGFRSNMPSFNFNDVIDLTLEYIENGKCTSVICPDFVTGGYYIKNDKELLKLMQTGLGRIKLRGKVTKSGKEITVVEFPFGKTIQALKKQAENANIGGIRDIGNVDDFEHGVGLCIDCTAKNRVDEVLLALYRDTDLQCTFSADMMTILEGKPVRYGVWGIIEQWVKWRREVLVKQYKAIIEDIKAQLRQSRAFMELVKDKEKLEEVTRLILKVSDNAAIDYMLENFDNEIIDRELATWIVRRRINAFRDGGKYSTQFNNLTASLRQYEAWVNDIDSVIKNQLLALKSRFGASHQRRTEITTEDYDFKVRETGEVVKDDTDCFFIFKNGFLRKQRASFNTPSEDEGVIISGSASDTLVAIDNRGRVLRIYCEDIPYSGVGELGTYIPKYCELDETDDYKIWWVGLLDGSTKMILYRDGNVGFLDTSEWIGLSRRVRVQEKGIATDCANIVGAVLDDIPEWLVLLDNERKVGVVKTSDIKQKGRTAKTRVFNLKKGCSLASFATATNLDIYDILSNLDYYYAPKMQFLRNVEDWKGTDVQFFQMFSME